MEKKDFSVEMNKMSKKSWVVKKNAAQAGKARIDEEMTLCVV